MLKQILTWKSKRMLNWKLIPKLSQRLVILRYQLFAEPASYQQMHCPAAAPSFPTLPQKQPIP
jgi:hypothetical protein